MTFNGNNLSPSEQHICHFYRRDRSLPRKLNFFSTSTHFQILFLGQNNPKAMRDALLSHVTQTSDGVRVPV